MSDEAAAAFAQALATALTQQGDTISASIGAGIASIGAMIMGFLIVAGIVALALSVKGSTDTAGNSNRDPILIIMAGISIILYSWGMLEPSIAQNTGIWASLVFMVGIYIIFKAATYYFSKR